ncbi:uncharacterized protein NEMAJ01_1103 [Nematocida major]|uniref:uncharacterized protein n=1 Tax=Nematocida major TaxID=1912982 RepID=UPI002008AF80|nr:uncharacterized protein NEMAJ01_1103 [Nematocida major]KAH9386207.1 hypothetical protein NEMAJ01_1103 [Nematocida major]
MLAQGADFVAHAKGKKVQVYALSSGMAAVCTIKGSSEISAISCDASDAFLLVGTASGALYYCNMSEKKEVLLLEDAEEIHKMSLKITSIYMLNGIVYVTSENGAVQILSIEIAQEKQHTSMQSSLTVEAEEKEGWMEEIESICETESLSMNISKAVGSAHVFKPLREIKHNTPISSTVVCGVNIYILDMRGRVIVFPSKVVYDNISEIHFRKYLFCVDGNTVFAEVGQVFTSVYFAEGPIKGIFSTQEGGYFFVLTDKAVEVMKIEEKGGKRVHRHELTKDVSEIVVDSQRSLIYAMVGSKPARMDIGYVWIDKKMEDLKIEGSTIKEVRREESETEEGDEYFDIPAVKAVKDMALPSIKYSSASTKPSMYTGAFEDHADDGCEKADSEIEELFASEDGFAERKTAVEMQMEKASAPLASRRPCVKNKVCGPVEVCNGQEKLLYWSAECSINLTNKTDYRQLEVKVRAQSVEMSIIKEAGEVHLAAGSKSLLVVCVDSLIKVYHSKIGVFSENSLVKTVSLSRKVERLLCGQEYFCVLAEDRLAMSFSVYSAGIQEIYSTFGTFRGVAACGEYIGMIVEQGEGVSVRVLKHSEGRVKSVSCGYFGRQAIDFCSISAEGILVFEAAGELYLLGADRIVTLSGSVPGVPISVVGGNIAYLLQGENGSVQIHPESVHYIELNRECSLGLKTGVYQEVVKEIADACTAGPGPAGQSSGGTCPRDTGASEDENFMYLNRKHKKPESARESSAHVPETGSLGASPMHTPTKKVKHTNPFART